RHRDRAGPGRGRGADQRGRGEPEVAPSGGEPPGDPRQPSSGARRGAPPPERRVGMPPRVPVGQGPVPHLLPRENPMSAVAPMKPEQMKPFVDGTVEVFESLLKVRLKESAVEFKNAPEGTFDLSVVVGLT